MFEIIAMLTMLIDHTGKVFFPSVAVFYIIGRIALPLYTYGIIQGFIYTKNFSKYIYRLLILACISQIFYALLFNTFHLNIIFTFVVALMLFKVIHKYNLSKLFAFILTVLTAVILQIFGFEGGLYTLLLAFIYYKGVHLLLLHTALNLFIAILVGGAAGWLQFFSLGATVIIVLMKNKRLKGHQRNFYRLFYPLHLAGLYIVKLLWL